MQVEMEHNSIMVCKRKYNGPGPKKTLSFFLANGNKLERLEIGHGLMLDWFFDLFRNIEIDFELICITNKFSSLVMVILTGKMNK